MNAFLSALKSAAVTQVTVAPAVPTKKPEPVQAIDTPLIDVPSSVEFFSGQKGTRIELYFDAIPSGQVRQAMKDVDWWFDPEKKCWHNFDTALNRAWIEKFFGIELPAPEPVTIPEPAQVEEKVAVYTAEFMTADYARFRSQVDELQRELKIGAADLMLAAIDCLHKKMFSKDS